jgi:DNA polymerase III subunit gamma/tau
VQLFYQIATIGRSELGLAPDEYAGFTMALLRMLAFEPAPTGGGGATGGGARSAGPAGAVGGAGARRAGATVAAAGAMTSARESQAGGSATNRGAESAESSAPAAERVAREAGAQPDVAARSQHSAAAAQAGHAMESQPVATSTVDTPSAGSTAHALAPRDDEPAHGVTTAAPAAPTANEFNIRTADAAASASAPSASAAAAPAQSEAASPETQPAVSNAPRRAGGASAALDVLRSAGLKISSDRGRAGAAASAAKPAAPVAPAAPKPAAPRVAVPVPTPVAARREPQQDAAPAARKPSAPPARTGSGNDNSRRAAEQNDSSVPPWDDIPLDDYVPISASDDAYFAPPDDHYMPVFDRGPDDVRVNAAPAASAPAPVVDSRPLPAAVPLDPLGFSGDWPALAVDLPLKGISYQLAFNSELMALDGNTLKLNVPVPQYAEASQVAKLKSALAEKLGRSVEVLVEVGAARRTAAARDAALRAQRQQEAEREIGADPFVQSLIREFGASIVPGSIRPITSGDASNGASPAH